MPLFEYECLNCKARFEQLVYSSSAEVACRQCGSTKLARLLSTFAVAGRSDKIPSELGPCGSCNAAQRGECGIE